MKRRGRKGRKGRVEEGGEGGKGVCRVHLMIKLVIALLITTYTCTLYTINVYRLLGHACYIPLAKWSVLLFYAWSAVHIYTCTCSPRPQNAQHFSSIICKCIYMYCSMCVCMCVCVEEFVVVRAEEVPSQEDAELALQHVEQARKEVSYCIMGAYMCVCAVYVFVHCTYKCICVYMYCTCVHLVIHVHVHCTCMFSVYMYMYVYIYLYVTVSRCAGS